MKAIVIHELGDESVLKYETAPDPVVGAGSVLIRVKAASINRGDLSRRAGSYGAPAGRFPFIVGWEVAGVVEAIGPGVRERKVGERVVATLADGGYAELASVREAGVWPIPPGVSFEAASTIPIVFLTSWFALVKIAGLTTTETALVQAAASGVGMAGIQIAKHLGARVITTAGADAKLAWARTVGADEAINYTTHDFLQETMRLTQNKGVDVVLEHVGGEVFQKSILALARGGRLVTVGNTLRQAAEVDPSLLLRQNRSIHGFFLGGQMAAGGVRQEMDKVLALVAEGKLKTFVDKVFPLKDAAEAHRYVGQRKNLGKVVLAP